MSQVLTLFQKSLSIPLGGIVLASVLLAAIASIALVYGLVATRRMRLCRERIDKALPRTPGQRRRPGDSLEESLGKLIDELNSSSGSDEDERRAELIADISHDLRTPITAVQGYLETLISLGDSLSPEERKEYAQTALRNTQSVIAQVRDLLEVFKTPQDGPVINPEVFPLGELFIDLKGRFVQRADQKGVSLQVKPLEKEISVRADRRLIDRAISNLLANAIRYTPTNGIVKLTCTQVGKQARVTLQDTGIGIPQEDLPYIFDRFYRVNKDRSRATGGAGLGLAISGEILENHRAELEVRSEPGKGTVFSFLLDCA